MPKKKPGAFEVWVHVLGALVVLLIFAGAFAFRLWLGGGSIPCVFSEDPALCATVSSLKEAP